MWDRRPECTLPKPAQPLASCPFGRPETYSRVRGQRQAMPKPPGHNLVWEFEMLLHPSEVERIRRKDPGGFRTMATPPYGRPRRGRPSLLLCSLLSSCFFSLLASLLIQSPTRSVCF